MAFKEKNDYFGLLSGNTGLILKSSNQNASASVADAKNARGDIFASTVYGESEAPSCDFEVKADIASLAAVCGSIHTFSSKKYVLLKIVVKTTAGGVPTVTVEGSKVADDAVAGATIDLSSLLVAISHYHKAQILAGAFTLSGEGVELNECTLTIAVELSTATKDGVIYAHDIHGAAAEVTASFVQSGTVAPSVTPASGWQITSPLSETNPDSDYPTFAITLRKPLVTVESTTTITTQED